MASGDDSSGKRDDLGELIFKFGWEVVLLIVTSVVGGYAGAAIALRQNIYIGLAFLAILSFVAVMLRYASGEKTGPSNQDLMDEIESLQKKVRGEAD